MLVDELGEEQVFRDVDGINPGRDCVEVLKRTLDNVDTLMVLIGPDWLSSADQAGVRRLDKPSDLVRLEIAHSLERDIVVMPLLVEGAAMPRADEQPADLQALCRRQYLGLADKRWDSDVERILEALGKGTGLARKSRRTLLLTGLSAIAASFAGVAIWKTWIDEPSVAAYRTNGCLQGYVWREAFPEDSVCVVTEGRSGEAGQRGGQFAS